MYFKGIFFILFIIEKEIIKSTMENQPQNPEFRINPENFHPCIWSSTQDFATYHNSKEGKLISHKNQNLVNWPVLIMGGSRKFCQRGLTPTTFYLIFFLDNEGERTKYH